MKRNVVPFGTLFEAMSLVPRYTRRCAMGSSIGPAQATALPVAKPLPRCAAPAGTARALIATRDTSRLKRRQRAQDRILKY